MTAGPSRSSALWASIVIPVLHDASELERLLDALTAGLAMDPADYEVVVVNGDPDDQALRLLGEQHPRVRWADSAPGRATQMNAGAALATGHWILFLHADARVEPQWIEELRQVGSSSVVGGAYAFRIAGSAWWARIIERGVAWRVRWFALPYGDQGIFVRRDIFRRLGGYRSLPIMEDVELVRRLGRIGTLYWSSCPVTVSPRRWERDGWLTRSVVNVGLLLLYFAGVSPSWLARMYYGRDPSVADDPGRRGATTIATPDTELSVSVIVPALNEAEAIGAVLDEIPPLASSVTVVDNGSTDQTVELAVAGGAHVVSEPQRGYGRACLAGLRADSDGGIVVFLDADRSDFPAEMKSLVAPIRAGNADLVLGYREGVGRPWSARMGTALCVTLINLLWRTSYRDLGPFRAVRRDALDRLGMVDQTWGWTIEMQVKAKEAGLRIVELPVNQRPRLGQSKISGTVIGVVRAGTRMIMTILALWTTRHRRNYG